MDIHRQPLLSFGIVAAFKRRAWRIPPIAIVVFGVRVPAPSGAKFLTERVQRGERWVQMVPTWLVVAHFRANGPCYGPLESLESIRRLLPGKKVWRRPAAEVETVGQSCRFRNQIEPVQGDWFSRVLAARGGEGIQGGVASCSQYWTLDSQGIPKCPGGSSE
jgi:hypothetical protein